MKRIAAGTLGIVLLVLFCMLPIFEVVVVPAWTINVLDSDAQPLAGIKVEQHWHHWSFDGSGMSGSYGGTELGVSNAAGEIDFPKRSFRASLFNIAASTIGSPMRWINVHESTGPRSTFYCKNASCFSDGPHYRGNSDDLLKNVITVKSRD